MGKDEALKQALEALEKIAYVTAMNYEYQRWAREAITVITAALAQPAQEPTGMLHIERLDKWLDASLKERKQREWVGLASEDRLCAKYMQEAPDGIESVIDYIEAKLKEKNNG